jgi:hypothetical protein
MGLTLALGSTGTKKPADDIAIKRGLGALRDQWKLGLTNRLKSLGGIPYLLYSIERACMLTGQQMLGDIDWYVEGAWILLHRRDAAGAFVDGNNMGHEPLAAHCFSLLFLKRAFIPVATPSNSKPESSTARSDPPVDKPREME